MFVIYCASPVYDSRDGYAASEISRVGNYVYETKGLALRKVPSGVDEDGQSDDCYYFCAEANDPWRRPIPLPNRRDVDLDFDDCPF